MKNIISLIIILFTFNNCTVENDNIVVIDCYELGEDEVKICNQIWKTKDLDVDHYRNGDSIPEVRNAAEWANLTTGAWCYYNNDPALGAIYEKLYNWYAVNDPRGLAPKGWHVPTEEDFKKLEKCLGMEQSQIDTIGFRGTDEGGKLKSVGTKEKGDGLWATPNAGATNESGFNALPNGWRSYIDGEFSQIGLIGHWWASTEFDSSSAWNRSLHWSQKSIVRLNYNKKMGFSVRCVKN